MASKEDSSARQTGGILHKTLGSTMTVGQDGWWHHPALGKPAPELQLHLQPTRGQPHFFFFPLHRLVLFQIQQLKHI